MALYIVVHHQQDSHKPWQNNWIDDEQLETIQTTAEIGRMCEQAQRRGERVFVHRCAWGSFAPVVCCSVQVAQVASIDRRTSLVTFSEPMVLNLAPPFSPLLGQNFYEAARSG